MLRTIKKTGLGALAALVMTAGSAIAADFPERTVELIHPWGPGNAMSVSQIIAKAMGEEMGVDMPVISTPGAAGTKAQITAMSKPADGYTVFDGYVAPLVLQPVLGNADWNYDDSPAQQFADEPSIACDECVFFWGFSSSQQVRCDKRQYVHCSYPRPQ